MKSKPLVFLCVPGNMQSLHLPLLCSDQILLQGFSSKRVADFIHLRVLISRMNFHKINSFILKKTVSLIFIAEGRIRKIAQHRLVIGFSNGISMVRFTPLVPLSGVAGLTRFIPCKYRMRGSAQADSLIPVPRTDRKSTRLN